MPISKGGRSDLDNITIMCNDCQQRKADNIWPGLVSLWQEEYENGRPPLPPLSYKIDINETRYTTMTTSFPSQHPQKSPTPLPPIKPVWQQRADEIEHKFQELSRELRSEIIKLHNRIDSLEKEIEQGGGKSRKPKDTINQQIVDFLKQYPGLKFNTGSIGGNIGLQADRISGRLSAMVGHGIIKAEKLKGHSAMYWVEKEDTNEQV